MTNLNQEMKLGAFFMIPGHHVAAWRHPKAEAHDVMNFDFIKRLAQTAERGDMGHGDRSRVPFKLRDTVKQGGMVLVFRSEYF
jgi:hypothetical protein